MAVFQEPTQWDHELGNNADVSSLPDDTNATTGVASLQKLFQIINQTPLEAGGVAPDREDFNALFKYLGDQIFYTQNGGVPSYNPDYDYIVGRRILYTDGNLYKCIQANGASSTVVAPDSVDPVGSDYWEQVATLSDFANLANTDLSNLSASGQTLFTNKADKDFSNIDNTAKIAIAHNAMPSDVYDDLTLGANRATYTAQADGFFFLQTTSSGADAYITLTNTTSGLASRGYTGVANYFCIAFIPCFKGDSIKIEYYNIYTGAPIFRFIYAVGSESEQ